MTLRSHDWSATGPFRFQPGGTDDAIRCRVAPCSSVEDDLPTLDPRWSPSGGKPCRIIGLAGTDDPDFDACKRSGTIAFKKIEKILPCFTPGTRIATIRGEMPVELLREGDRVITRDNGIQEIRWVGARRLTRDDLTRHPGLRPVLIRKAALGHGLPGRDMLVSPNHRVLSASDETALRFAEREVLVVARHLCHVDGIDQVKALGASYIHFLFDRHEVVLSDGTWTESFPPSDTTLSGIEPAQRAEILKLFPEFADGPCIKGYEPARRSLKQDEAGLLMR